MEILVALVLLVGAMMLRRGLSVERPGKFQHLMELVVEFTRELNHDLIGHGSERYIALVGTLGLFVLLGNLLGVIPTLESPTASVPVTLGCAVVAFLYYNFQGIRQHGAFGYVKHLCGPMIVIAPLMLPIEIFSNFFRLLSLTARLWANMFVGPGPRGDLHRADSHCDSRYFYGFARVCVILAGIRFHATARCVHRLCGRRGTLGVSAQGLPATVRLR